jgi:hypothetical protein
MRLASAAPRSPVGDAIGNANANCNGCGDLLLPSSTTTVRIGPTMLTKNRLAIVVDTVLSVASSTVA